MDDSLHGVLSQSEGVPGSPVAGVPPDEPQRGWEELLEASQEAINQLGGELPLKVRLWDLELSPGTRLRLKMKEKKAEQRRARPEHYKVRRARRRAEYWAWERESKLRRDRWMCSTPEGFWFYYKNLTKKKGFIWDIAKEDFIEILSRETASGLRIYERIFDLVRLDKSNKRYSLDNIAILDRYTREKLY